MTKLVNFPLIRAALARNLHKIITFLCDFSSLRVGNRRILCNFAAFLGTKDIVGSTLPITTSDNGANLQKSVGA